MQINLFEDQACGRHRREYGSSSQNRRVLNYLQRYGSITQEVAKQNMGVARLAARIKDLKDDGWTIETKIVEVPTRWRDKTARVAQYILKGGRK